MEGPRGLCVETGTGASVEVGWVGVVGGSEMLEARAVLRLERLRTDSNISDEPLAREKVWSRLGPQLCRGRLVEPCNVIMYSVNTNLHSHNGRAGKLPMSFRTSARSSPGVNFVLGRGTVLDHSTSWP